jgi:TatD DNase family protein
VGETGLDFYRHLAPRPVAEAVFRQHLELAVNVDLPVIIHSRQAHDVVLDILESLPRRPPGVLHSFDGPLATARRALDLGLHLSFTGVLTYPSAENLRQVAGQLPLDRLLLETDCPYLAPQLYRGKRNEPAYVVAVAGTLAQLHHLPLADVARITSESASRLFRLHQSTG